MMLMEFLLARFAEDERHWGNPAFIRVSGPDLSTLVKYVRADIEAKRQTVELARRHLGDGDYGRGMEKILEVMALPYADHPDFQEEWRP